MPRLYPKSFEGLSPREFGVGANILKTRTFDLANARDLEQIEIGGSCIWAITATSLTAQIDIRINDQLRDPLTFQQGMFVRGIPFSRVYVSHSAQPAETITLFFAVEQDIRNIEVVNPSTQFNNVNVGTIDNDISSWYYSSRGTAFVGSGRATVAGVGGISPSVQLWNPADSGKNLICHGIQVLSDYVIGNAMALNYHNAAISAVPGIFGNKYMGGGIGVGDIWIGTDIAVAGTQITNFFRPVVTTPYDFPLYDPVQSFVIPQGMGLHITTAVNSTSIFLFVMFQWVEVDA